MDNHSNMTNPDVENINEEDSFESMSNESRELFKQALSEVMDSKIRKIEEETKDMEIPSPSKRHKIRMNRLFREQVGGSFIPFPEEDNLNE